MVGLCERRQVVPITIFKVEAQRVGTGRGESCKLLKIWWTWSGSNRRPLPCHGSALPAAPQAHKGRSANSILADTYALVKPTSQNFWPASHLFGSCFSAFVILFTLLCRVRSFGMLAA